MVLLLLSCVQGFTDLYLSDEDHTALTRLAEQTGKGGSHVAHLKSLAVFIKLTHKDRL
jgi:hypothetical protein